MAYVLLGILVLGLVASIYIAFMSSRTWPIYQAVLVVFVFIAALVFFYLGARTLATHKAWRELYERNQQQAASLENQLLPLVGGINPQGTGVTGEIPTLKNDLALAVAARGGGVYYSVKADAWQNGVLQVTLSPPGTLPPLPASATGEPGAPGAEGQPAEELPVEQPPAEAPAAEGAEGAGAEAKKIVHGLVADTVLFVFDQKPLKEGGSYLGEFKVVEAAPDSPSAKLAPNLPLTAAQAKRMETIAPGMLVMYTTMPPDDALLFAKMEPAARQALLPPQTAEEYAQADRPLRDYQAFFHENYVQRGLLSDAISQTNSNIQRVEGAAAETTKEAGYREAEQGKLASDLEKFQAEVKAIAAYEQSLKKVLSQVRDQLKATYIENRNAAETLTREQLKAAEEINRRTNVAAS